MLVITYEQITQGAQSFVQSGLENLWGSRRWTLVESHEVHMVPLLKLIQVFMDDIPSLRCLNCTTQLAAICKFAEGALSPSVCVIDEDIRHYSSLNWTLKDTTCHWCSSGHGVVGCYPHAIVEWLSWVSFFLLLAQNQLSWKRDSVNSISFPFSHNFRIILPEKSSWWRPSIMSSNPPWCWTEKINSGYARGVW